MATNNFLPWGDNAGNIMDGADYEASTQRTDGVELGLADPALHNRLYRQVTLMAAALGQVIADSGLDASDSNMADLVRAIKQVFFPVVPVDKGGTGATDAAGARENLGITPGNIGAAPTSHTHSAGNITSGIIPIVRGGTGADNAATARANLGALATSGGPITGYLQFGSVSNGLEWFTADGTQIHLRPYIPGNSFQITLEGPNTDDQEIGAFNLSTTGDVTLNRPLGLASGGLGRSFANEATLKNYLKTLLGI